MVLFAHEASDKSVGHAAAGLALARYDAGGCVRPMSVARLTRVATATPQVIESVDRLNKYHPVIYGPDGPYKPKKKQHHDLDGTSQALAAQHDAHCQSHADSQRGGVSAPNSRGRTADWPRRLAS